METHLRDGQDWSGGSTARDYGESLASERCVQYPPTGTGVSAPALLEFRQVAPDPTQNHCVRQRMPRSAVMITKSLRLRSNPVSTRWRYAIKNRVCQL